MWLHNSFARAATFGFFNLQDSSYTCVLLIAQHQVGSLMLKNLDLQLTTLVLILSIRLPSFPLWRRQKLQCFSFLLLHLQWLWFLQMACRSCFKGNFRKRLCSQKHDLVGYSKLSPSQSTSKHVICCYYSDYAFKFQRLLISFWFILIVFAHNQIHQCNIIQSIYNPISTPWLVTCESESTKTNPPKPPFPSLPTSRKAAPVVQSVPMAQWKITLNERKLILEIHPFSTEPWLWEEG